MKTTSPRSVLSKSLLAAMAGAAMLVACARGEDPVEKAAAQPDAEQVPAARAFANEMSSRPSAVTCSGDQNQDGRICCDATHCCINIRGVINCKLPPRKAQLQAR